MAPPREAIMSFLKRLFGHEPERKMKTPSIHRENVHIPGSTDCSSIGVPKAQEAFGGVL